MLLHVWTADATSASVFAGMSACIHHCVPSATGLWAWQTSNTKKGQVNTNTDNSEFRGAAAVSISDAVG
jgi:hypothetical protein